MEMIGRALIRRGEIVFYIDVVDGRLVLLPCQSHDVEGGPDPATWRYRCTVSGPERTWTYDKVPATGVVHLTYGRDPERPWRGYGPLQVAQLAGRLSASTVATLADEAGGSHGYLLPMPAVGGQDETVDQLRADIKALKGQVALVESTQSMAAGAATPRSDWEPKRLGADPPAALVELLHRASVEVYSACGLSPAIFAAEGQGTAMREAWRQALFGCIAPLGRLVSHELTTKLDAPVTLDWQELRASDISGRARAFQSMVGAGMDPAKAAALSGLMVDDG